MPRSLKSLFKALLFALLGIGSCSLRANEPVVVLEQMKVSADCWRIDYAVDEGGLVKQAIFSEVFPKTTLWKHGVRVGDVILNVNGKPISSFTGEEFGHLLGPGLKEGASKVLTIKSGHRDIFFRRTEYTLSITPTAPTPNKSVESTPTAVTPAADAPGAPSAGVPHH